MKGLSAVVAVCVLVPALSFAAVPTSRATSTPSLSGRLRAGRPALTVPMPAARPGATVTERAAWKAFGLRDKIVARFARVNAKIQEKWPAWLPRTKVAWAGKFARGFGYGLAGVGAVTLNPMLVGNGMMLAWAGRSANRLALPDEPEKEGLFSHGKLAMGGRFLQFGMRLFGGASRRAGVLGVLGGGLMLNPWIAGGGIAIQAAGGLMRALSHRMELRRSPMLAPFALEPEPAPFDEPAPRAPRVAPASPASPVRWGAEKSQLRAALP